VVKRILRHLAQDQGFIDLFLNEAQLAAQLQHPHIVQIYGLEHEGQAWFIAMEYVHGRSLRDLLAVARNKSIDVPPALAARLASQALQGLDYAHRLTDARGNPLGILHRDVTPDNLLVAFSGVLKLLDFGIARAMTGAVTRIGRPKGKVGYMAPELTVSGTSVDARADVFGVGVVLYEMLRLARPPNVPTTSDAVTREWRPFQPDPKLPAALNAILAKAMAPSPSERFPSARAMSEALEAWLLGRPVLAGDISAFMSRLYDKWEIDANPAVLPLAADSAPDEPTALGTQPLITALPESDPSHAALRPLLLPPDPPPRTSPLRLAALFGGTIVLAALGFWVLAFVWPPPAMPRSVDAGTALAAHLTPEPDAAVPPVVNLAFRIENSTDAAVEAADDGGEPDEDVANEGSDDEGADAGLGPERTAVETSRPPARQNRKGKVGRVAFKVNPGTEISLRGRTLGVAPIDPVEVKVGVATFVLRHRKFGSTRRVSVRVQPGKTTVLKADLSGR
jgi:hypothetical protein